ncbi:hypothetical protein Hanom_Chr01g00025571 [Helianthus anomalus]
MMPTPRGLRTVVFHDFFVNFTPFYIFRITEKVYSLPPIFHTHTRGGSVPYSL